MPGPTQTFEQEGDLPPLTHAMFGSAAVSKLMLPTSDLNASYALANAAVAIYGVLAEISTILQAGAPPTPTPTQRRTTSATQRRT